ncbi:sulfatase [Stieleria varia]|uniref:Arylsulfatase n=1 Tax=Stieleria varia TaxID=2528005 RepID=A0A5C6BAY7_9BACT|nr:sulfatase [Stieleria varia]TWU08426.1 Arylsulfatase [Stieleria varia]
MQRSPLNQPFFIVSFFAAFLNLYSGVMAAGAQRKPNVVLILADDLGWSDTTLYGTTDFYRTPNIQRLAARGMTFTHAYSASPLCSPTRASVLTGLSPARTGITTPNCHLPAVVLTATAATSASPIQKSTQPNPVTRLDTRYYTVAEMFQDNGYVTAHFGKWHLGPEPYSPLQHGFDIDVPHWAGPGPAGSYVAPWKFPDFDPQTPAEHIEDRMADEAVRFMEKHQDKPFFLNYWMFSVHAPFDAKAKLIEQYRSRINPSDPQRSPTYAAMIESMDDAVGTLLDTLDRLQLAENTIIIFASDNGGNMYNEVDGTTPTSNAPLRGGKATMYEGGIRGPAIIAAPGVTQPGSRSDAVIQSCDYYPTLLDLLDISAQPEQTFDGVSLAPALKSQPLTRDAIFTYFPHAPGVPDWLPPAVSVHVGDWKLIRLFHGGENGKHRYKLYDLSQDLGERSDLADKYPERVQEMDARIDAFLSDTGAVVPLPNPKFDPTKYNPEREGQATLKGSGSKQTRNEPAPRQKPIAGWQADNHCTLAIADSALQVISSGGDPHFSYLLPKPIPAGELTLRFTMSSQSTGNGQLFWREQGEAKAFHRDRSVDFSVTHDGQSHEYDVKFSTATPLQALRVDPSRSAGKLKLSNLRLTDNEGKILYTWKF